MAGASEGFGEFLREQLAPLGHLSLRRLFGTTGVFSDGAMIGLVRDDVLFLRVVSGEAADGAQPSFSYRRDGRDFDLPYRRVPDRLLDAPDELLDRARTALGEARRVALRRRARGSRARQQGG